MKGSENQLKWHRLDNTAKIFPIITSENLSNVFRISCVLNEKVDPELLQAALEDVLKWFDGFNVRLRRGFFWYYFETNKKVARVQEEDGYPCQYIDPVNNQNFMFRVSYYNQRINFEVFHAITDGIGAINFLKQLTYRYLELKYFNADRRVMKPSSDCILDTEDSYLKYYKDIKHKPYSSCNSYMLEGDCLYTGVSSVIHGYISVEQIKQLSRSKGVSITKYLVALLIYCIYKEYLNESFSSNPIAINLPINLRSFFDSTTTMNFFGITNIEYTPSENGVDFDDILKEVSSQMDEKITKENMEKIISYNVSNEKKAAVKYLPLGIKYVILQMIYSRISRRNTMTLSNLGPIDVEEKYRPYINSFNVLIGVSEKQRMKCGILSYGDRMEITFTSVLKETYLQRAFFRELAKRGLDVRIESNGVLNEKKEM